MTLSKKGLEPWNLFETRVKSASQAKRLLPYGMISPSEKQTVFESIFSQKASDASGVIYIHIPFCKKTCSFCIYNKQLCPNSQTIEKYVSSIISQIKATSQSPWAKSKTFSAVYFGGGTPTAIPASYLCSIIEALQQNFNLQNNCEITVESTISEINRENVALLSAAGVNRMSLGVQTFNSALRKSLGRLSNQTEIAKAISAIANSGISNICIDLMYSLPGQDLKMWGEDFRAIQTLPITGCSVYSLIDKPSPGKDLQEDLAKKKLDYSFFFQAEGYLEEMLKWEHFTPVQHGKRSIGNAVYITLQGQNVDILAFGPGAGGRIGSYSYLNESSIETFLEKPSGILPEPNLLMELEMNSMKSIDIFRLSENLKISKSDYLPMKEHFDDIIQEFQEKQLLYINEESIEITKLGRYWAGNMSARFAQRINDLHPKKS